MKLIDKPISRQELVSMAKQSFGNLVKGVVDVSKRVMVVDASLHSDEEAYLLTQGSKQSDLWGINLYPEFEDENFIEFDSMINLRPNQKNMSRGVDNPQIQKQIREIVASLMR